MFQLILNIFRRIDMQIRRFPKFVLVAVVLVGSTLSFYWWWTARQAKRPEAVAARQVQEVAAVKQLDDKITSRLDRLFMAGDDLYDAGTGELVFRSWFNHEKPDEIYYQKAERKIICRFERKFVRYDFEGKREAVLSHGNGIVVSSDLKTAFFPDSGDLWISDIDWPGFKLTKERRVTKLGNLQESNMLTNVVLSSEKFVVLRDMNQLLRIDLNTGNVIPVRLPLENRRGRSPDGGLLIGADSPPGGTRVFAYDLDKDVAKFEGVGKTKINDCLWVDREKAYILTTNNRVLLYDRPSDVFSQVCVLPASCQRLAGSSPDNRYLFATGQGLILIDTQEKKSEIFPPAGQTLEWIGNDTLLLSAEVPSSEHRGTWVQKVGGEPRRISADPYLVARDGTTAVMMLPDAQSAVFGTRDRLFRVNSDGDELKEIATLSRPVIRFQKLKEWPLRIPSGK